MARTLRIASCNGEWMNNWFTPDAQPAEWVQTFDADGVTIRSRDVAERLASLIRAIDADIVALEEAPSRREELELFLADCLSDGGEAAYRAILGDSGGQQKLAILFRKELDVRLAPGPEVAPLLEEWECDVDGDMLLEPYEFTRRPLVVDAALGGPKLRIIALHTKSNFVNRGEALWQQDRQAYVSAALKNRRRISAEAMHVRRYVERLLDQDPAARVVVLGDFNDGPGLDYFEEKYLSHNVTDILVGSTFAPERLFHNAQHDVPPDERYTAVFDDFVEGVKGKRMLLDHVLVSRGLAEGDGVRAVPSSGRVHHAEWQALVKGGGRRRDERPSDHRPVSVAIQY